MYYLTLNNLTNIQGTLFKGTLRFIYKLRHDLFKSAPSCFDKQRRTDARTHTHFP